jgi:hypothetical protein
MVGEEAVIAEVPAGQSGRRDVNPPSTTRHRRSRAEPGCSSLKCGLQMSAGRISGDTSRVQGASREPSGRGRKAQAYRRFVMACVGREFRSADLTVRAMGSPGAVNSAAVFDEAVVMKRHERVRVCSVQRSSPGGVGRSWVRS